MKCRTNISITKLFPTILQPMASSEDPEKDPNQDEKNLLDAETTAISPTPTGSVAAPTQQSGYRPTKRSTGGCRAGRPCLRFRRLGHHFFTNLHLESCVCARRSPRRIFLTPHNTEIALLMKNSGSQARG